MFAAWYTRDVTDELGKTGRDVWDAFGAASLDAASQALVRELARCADTLDRLNDLATGRREAWILLVFDDMGEIHLQIDRVLDEQRKTQVVFKTLFGELRQAGVKPQLNTSTEDEEVGPVDVLAALRKKKEARERQSG